MPNWKELLQDHILPVSKGGGLTQDNVQALCRSCNASKSDKHIDFRKKKHRK